MTKGANSEKDSESELLIPYAIRYSRQFQDLLDTLSAETFSKIDNAIELIGLMPSLGRVYSPQYESDLPPLQFWYVSVPRTYKQIFYTVNKAMQPINARLPQYKETLYCVLIAPKERPSIALNKPPLK